MMTRDLYVYRVDGAPVQVDGPPARRRVSLTVHPGALGERCRIEADTGSGASAWLIPSEDDYIAEAERWARSRWPACEITWIELDRQPSRSS